MPSGLKAANPGRRIITTPISPRTTAPIRLGVSRSESSQTASKAVHAGVINSSAKTVANGNSVNAVAQQYCAPKWITLRSKFSGIRRGRTSGRRSARVPKSVSIINRPTPLRMLRISKMFSLPASMRIDTAIAENERSVPVIQKTTRVRLLICTLLSSYDNSNDTRVREPNRGHSSILFREWRNQHAAHKPGVAPTFSQGDVRLGSLGDIS